MSRRLYSFQVTTTEGTDIIDITSHVQKWVLQLSCEDGAVLVFVPGSTASVTTIEYEPGVCRDLEKALERLIPRHIEYEHEKAWQDGNGYSHVRAALMKPSLVVPISEGRLLLGRWQQIVLLDFDNKARERKIYLRLLQ